LIQRNDPDAFTVFVVACRLSLIAHSVDRCNDH